MQALASIAKSIIMMAFFFTIPISMMTADEGVDIQLVMEQQQRRQRAHARGGKPGKNGDGMNEAFVQNSQHHIDHQDRSYQQQAQANEGRLKGRRYALGGGTHRGRKNLACGCLNAFDCVAQRYSRLQVEGYRHRGKLTQVDSPPGDRRSCASW